MSWLRINYSSLILCLVMKTFFLEIETANANNYNRHNNETNYYNDDDFLHVNYILVVDLSVSPLICLTITIQTFCLTRVNVDPTSLPRKAIIIAT